MHKANFKDSYEPLLKKSIFWSYAIEMDDLGKQLYTYH
jgi:hypothetical protein